MRKVIFVGNDMDTIILVDFDMVYRRLFKERIRRNLYQSLTFTRHSVTKFWSSNRSHWFCLWSYAPGQHSILRPIMLTQTRLTTLSWDNVRRQIFHAYSHINWSTSISKAISCASLTEVNRPDPLLWLAATGGPLLFPPNFHLGSRIPPFPTVGLLVNPKYANPSYVEMSNRTERNIFVLLFDSTAFEQNEPI